MNKSFSTVVYNNKFTMHSHLISFIIKIISTILYLNVKVIIRNHFFFASCSIILLQAYFISSAIIRLIAINHIQNKRFCLHNVCLCCLFIMYIYIKHTYMHVYIIFKVMFLY